MAIENKNSAEQSASASVLSLGLLEGFLGFRLRMAHTALYRDFSTAMADLNLTQKQCAVLVLLDANPGVSQIEIAAALGMDRASMMALVDRLDQRNLIKRQRSKIDKRRQELRLNALGVKILAEALVLINQHEERFLRKFTRAEQQRLKNDLKRLHESNLE